MTTVNAERRMAAPAASQAAGACGAQDSREVAATSHEVTRFCLDGKEYSIDIPAVATTASSPAKSALRNGVDRPREFLCFCLGGEEYSIDIQRE